MSALFLFVPRREDADSLACYTRSSYGFPRLCLHGFFYAHGPPTRIIYTC
jgi:hypothetical protein